MAFQQRTPFASSFFRDAFFDNDPFFSSFSTFGRSNYPRATVRSPIFDFFQPFQREYRPMSASPVENRRPTPPLDRRQYWEDGAPSTIFNRPYKTNVAAGSNEARTSQPKRTRIPIANGDDSDDEAPVLGISIDFLIFINFNTYFLCSTYSSPSRPRATLSIYGTHASSSTGAQLAAKGSH